MSVGMIIITLFFVLFVTYIKMNPSLNFFKIDRVGDEVKALAKSIDIDTNWRVQNSNFLFNHFTGGALWIHGGEDEVDYYPKLNMFNKKERNLLWKSIKIRIAKNTVLREGE